MQWPGGQQWSNCGLAVALLSYLELEACRAGIFVHFVTVPLNERHRRFQSCNLELLDESACKEIQLYARLRRHLSLSLDVPLFGVQQFSSFGRIICGCTCRSAAWKAPPTAHQCGMAERQGTMDIDIVQSTANWCSMVLSFLSRWRR